MRLVAALIATGVSMSVYGQVVRDLGSYGPTVDIRPFVVRLHNSRDANRAGTSLVAKASRFPIDSVGIEPGLVESQIVDLPELHAPVCVVGVDEISIRWIDLHRETLVSTQAICVVTNVRNADEVDSLKTRLHPVPVYAAAVNTLMDRAGISSYPVLISRNRVEQ